MESLFARVLAAAHRRFTERPFVALPPRPGETPGVLWMLPHVRVRPMYSVEQFTEYFHDDLPNITEHIILAQLPQEAPGTPKGHVYAPMSEAFMLIRAAGELLNCDTSGVTRDRFEVLLLTPEEVTALGNVREHDVQVAATFFVDGRGMYEVNVLVDREATEAVLDGNMHVPENWRETELGKQLLALPSCGDSIEGMNVSIKGAAARAIVRAWFAITRRRRSFASFTEIVEEVAPFLAP